MLLLVAPVFNGAVYKRILPDIRSLLPVPNFPNMIKPTTKSTVALCFRLGQLHTLAAVPLWK
jgi:hypothetical protein